MHFSKRTVLAATAVLCSALLYAGAISAGAAPNRGGDPAKSANDDKIAAYKAANDPAPVPPLTPDEKTTLDQKRQAATRLLSGAAGATNVSPSATAASASSNVAAATSGSSALTQDQNPQKTSYWCGPASVNEALGQMGKWFTQAQLASELGTTTSGTGWLNGSSGPVPRVMNSHQSRNNYVGTPVPGSPSSSDVEYFKLGLVTNIGVIRAPLIGDAYEVPGGPHLVGHPNTTIFHWFDIYGYTNGGAYTMYEDSVHGAPGIAWAGNVPAYSTLSSSTIVQIVGGRGYVW
ncbi:MAG: C39 family peptidase [Gaiellaceae bacterium]